MRNELAVVAREDLRPKANSSNEPSQIQMNLQGEIARLVMFIIIVSIIVFIIIVVVL